MAGHNKWSQIKRKKAKTDQQRGKVFTKIVREIMMAAKLGGGDPDGNATLRLAIQKAKDANMPIDNIKRAIQKGSGDGDANQLEEVTFEAYGPNGVGILIYCLTDNRNRTVPNIKHALSRGNGTLATKGAVSYLFAQHGVFLFENADKEETIIDLATDAGAEDIDIKDDGSLEVMCPPSQFETLKDRFDSADIRYESASIDMIPATTVSLDDDGTKAVMALIETLEDDDDIQEVYTNLDIPDHLFN